MTYNLRNRSFLKEIDFDPRELRYLLRLSEALKVAKYAGTEVQRLKGKEIALIFEKTSTRTRSAFEVGAYDQGAHVTYLDPSGSQLGHKESIADTAAVLGRMYDAIEYRGSRQADVESLAEHAGVPVYNGLTDEFHPTQMLADMLTMQEHSEKPLKHISYCYVGDARFNTGNSLMITGTKLGMDVRICAPQSLWPDPALVETAQGLARETGGRLLLTDDVDQGVSGVDFLCTDVWVSMGEDKSVWKERIELLLPYQVNMKMIERTGNPAVRFMHCLPAFHDRHTKVGEEIYEEFGLEALEVTDEVFESKHSVVFDEAENRMHTIKAVLVATLGS
jgi:ornithine carbamoyltransferase